MCALFLITSVLVAFSGSSAIADGLIKREVNQVNPGGKNLIISFAEVRRDEKVSTARVVFVSGASVPSSMFIMRGFYEIARARGATHFIKLKEWRAEDGNTMFLVGFANSGNINAMEYFNLSEPIDVKFMAVSNLDLMFKDHQ